MNRTNTSIAQPYAAQINELGDNVITMYQFIGNIYDKSLWIGIIINLYE